MSGEVRADRRLLDAGRQTRTMRWVMAIMLFLTVLAAALGMGTLGASRALDDQLAGRLTVELIAPDPGAGQHAVRRIVDALRRDPKVSRVDPVDPARLATLIEPWLGAVGNDPDLPMPMLIDVDLKAGSAAAVATITRTVQSIAPTARIDRHASWMRPVTQFMDLLLALAAGIVLLLALATGTVVVLAARAGLDTHRHTIEIMHMLGSTDVQVARLFQRRIARETLIGGLIGVVAALLVTALVGARLAGLGSALASGAALVPTDWLALILIPLLFVLLAMAAARIAVLRALGQTL